MENKVKTFLFLSLLCFQSFICRADWDFPAGNLSAAGQDSFGPQVAMDPSGNVVAVWMRFDGSNYIVQARRYDVVASTWSGATDLTAAGRDAINPQVAMDDLGNAVAVWYRSDGSNLIVQARRYDVVAGTWSAVTDLSAVGQHAYDPQVAMDDLGNAVAVWYRSNGSHDIVQTRRYNVVAGTWSTVEDLSAAGQSAYEPQVAMDSSGNAFAVWIRSDGSNFIVQARRYDIVAGTWSAVIDLSAVGQHASRPQVAMDSSGNAVAVWYRSNGSHNIAQSRRYDVVAGTWSAVIDLSASGQSVAIPQVAMDQVGNAFAVWSRQSGINFIVQTRKYNVLDDTWSVVTDLSAAGQNAGGSQVAMDKAGNAVAVWIISDGSNTIVQARRYSVETGTWQTVEELSVVGQSAFSPQVAMDQSGNAVTVWHRSDGSNDIVQTSRYDGEVYYVWQTVEDLSAAGQNTYDPQVASDEFGNAVAVWRRFDGSNYRVQTSRYNAETDTWSAVETISVAGRNAYDPQVSIDSSGEAVVVWRRYDGSKYITQTVRSKLFYQ